MRKSYKHIPRLYVDSTLAKAQVILLSKEQFNHLINVMRLENEADILLFNGKDGEWKAKLNIISKKQASALITEQSRKQTTLAETKLMFAPLKNGRAELIVEKATELGVTTISPVKTARTNIPKINEKRMVANAIKAAEQSERLDIPKIEDYTSLESILHEWDEDFVLLYGDETMNGISISDALNATSQNKNIAILIGPEGGFSYEELEALSDSNFAIGISLGPRILRADTAAIASLALLQFLRGERGSTNTQ